MTLEFPAGAPGSRPAPLFVLGPPRSGTTFLRQVLDAHPEIFVTDELRAPSWLVQEAAKLGEGRVVHGNPYPLTLGKPFAEHLLASAERLLLPFYLRQARRAGKPAIRYWGDKYPHYDEILHLLPGLFPDARYVMIHRDLRDTICSVVATFEWPVEKAAPFVCVIYDRYVRRADELVAGGVVPADRFLHVNYLDLNTGAAAEAGRLFAALGLDYPAATAARVQELADTQAHSIRRSTRAPRPFEISASQGRWARDLSPDALRLALTEIAGIAEAVAIGNRQQPGSPFSYPEP